MTGAMPDSIGSLRFSAIMDFVATSMRGCNVVRPMRIHDRHAPPRLPHKSTPAEILTVICEDRFPLEHGPPRLGAEQCQRRYCRDTSTLPHNGLPARLAEGQHQSDDPSRDGLARPRWRRRHWRKHAGQVRAGRGAFTIREEMTAWGLRAVHMPGGGGAGAGGPRLHTCTWVPGQ